MAQHSPLHLKLMGDAIGSIGLGAVVAFVMITTARPLRLISPNRGIRLPERSFVSQPPPLSSTLVPPHAVFHRPLVAGPLDYPHQIPRFQQHRPIFFATPHAALLATFSAFLAAWALLSQSFRRKALSPSRSSHTGHPTVMTMAAVSSTPAAAETVPKKVVAIGSAIVDYVASVDHFPTPDEKMRTTALEVLGGGNAGNAATAMVRLGLRVSLVAKVGGDGLGAAVVAELKRDAIDTTHVSVDPSDTTPFSYIIVDADTQTRTILHTPARSGDLEPAAVDPSMLDGASLLFCDGRNTLAATELARMARSRGIPVIVEGERARPHLDALLALADVVVTSTSFPTAWTGEKDLGVALKSLLTRLPARTVITTLGKTGSLRLDRDAATPAPADLPQAIQMIVEKGDSAATACGPIHITFQAATPLRPEEVVDTTGAGDAYIGATCYALVQALSPSGGMRLAAEVAARKCRQLGARPGLPFAKDLPPELLAGEGLIVHQT